MVSEAGVNPREIKRYINAYTLQRKISEELDPDVVLTLQTIAFRPDWRHVHAAILAYGPLLIETLARYVYGRTAAFEELDPKLVVPDSLLQYVAAGRPGNVILSPAEDGSHPEEGKLNLKHADDIDEYVYRGEAVRTPQDPFLLDAIRSSGEARLLLMKAKAADDDRMRLVGEASSALLRGGLGAYMEFGEGSVAVREFILQDWNAYWKIEARLRDSEREANLQTQDLEELSRLAVSMSDRLLGIYRAGAASAAGG